MACCRSAFRPVWRNCSTTRARLERDALDRSRKPEIRGPTARVKFDVEPFRSIAAQRPRRHRPHMLKPRRSALRGEAKRLDLVVSGGFVFETPLRASPAENRGMLAWSPQTNDLIHETAAGRVSKDAPAAKRHAFRTSTAPVPAQSIASARRLNDHGCMRIRLARRTRNARRCPRRNAADVIAVMRSARSERSSAFVHQPRHRLRLSSRSYGAKAHDSLSAFAINVFSIRSEHASASAACPRCVRVVS